MRSSSILRLALILGLITLTAAAQRASGPRGAAASIVAEDNGTILGPPGDPFNLPSDVAVGPDGTLYILDGVNHRVLAYDAEGQFQFQFGSPGDRPGQFLRPLGIATDPAGTIYVADSGNHRVQVFGADGRPREIIPLPAGVADLPPDPTDVAVDPGRNRLYIADNDNHSIHVYHLTDRRFEAVWGSPGQGQRQLRFPFLIDVSAQGYLLVVESINTRVQVLNPESKFVSFIGGWGIDPGQLFRPKGVAVGQDQVFVTDSYLGTIQVFELGGRFLGTLADPTGTPMAFTTPTGIALDAARHRLYVVELKAHRVRRLDLHLDRQRLKAGRGKLETPPVGPIGSFGRSARPNLRSGPPSGTDTPPNRSRECAICHIRWVQALGGSSPSEGAMHDILERQAGSGDMCLSCHDGSAVDSRFKVWSTRHHTTDAAPSPAVQIPTEVFPLDAQGRMTCATCHTAHAVPGDSDLRTVIFLRQPNVDSSLCLACHPDHAQKSDRHHPLGHQEAPIPAMILDAGGKTAADGRTILCQTCHEPHGARHAWMLVLPPSQLCTACHADKAPEAAPPAGAPVHRIGYTYAGFQPPKTLLEEKATFGPNGELSCLSCHRLHDASGVRPLLIHKNEDSSLCLGCHEKERTVLGSPHDLRRSSPQTVNAQGETASVSGPCGACHRIHGWARDVPQTNPPHSSGCLECHTSLGPGSAHRPYVESHPMGVPVPEDATVPLPLEAGTRTIGCLTCHDPHVPAGDPSPVIRDPEHGSRVTGHESREIPAAGGLARPPAEGLFLRRPGSELCVLCHDKVADSLLGPHDPGRFAPALHQTLGVSASAGACRVCHTAHNARGLHLWARPPLDSAAGPISNLCGACHNQDAVKRPPQTHHPLGLFPAKQMKPGDSGPPSVEVSCTTCHDHHGRGLSGDFPQNLCLTCHEDKQGIRGSVHDPGANEWAGALGFISKDLCRACHPIHGSGSESSLVDRWRGSLRPTSDVLRDEHPKSNRSTIFADLCEACHGTEGPGPIVHTPHLGKAIPQGRQDRTGKLVISADKRIQCPTCHDIHQSGKDSKLLRAARQDSDLCILCHADLRRLAATAHDLRKSAPQAHNVRGENVAKSGPCGVCHLVHPSAAGNETWAQHLPPDDIHGRGVCTGCHQSGGCAERRIPALAHHPDVPLLNRLPAEDPNYMPLFDERGRPSPMGIISCPTCHQVHTSHSTPLAPGEDPPSHPMFLRSAHQRLCADCHGPEAPWRFLYYHRAGRNPQRR